jgi:uncharacterized membrane protein
MDKKLVVGVILLTGFTLAVSVASMYAQSHLLSGTACDCQFPIELLIPVLSSGGVLVGSLVYYFMASSRKERKDILPLLQLVDYDQRAIIQEIAKAGGSMAQSKLVDATGFNKVKVSRLVSELESKGVLAKSPSGVTNQVELEQKIKKILV